MKAMATMGVTLGVVLVTASTAWSQVTQTQTGQALDANSQVGSGGYNPVRTDGRIDSQLYVNGQVSGLAGFRGSLDYSASNELQIDVPSAGLSDFRRRSVGLDDALRGGSYRTSAYYDSSRTVFGAGSIAAGRSVSGSLTQSVGSGGRDSSQLYIDATRDYVGLMDFQRPGALNVDSMASGDVASRARLTGWLRDTDLLPTPRAPVSPTGLLDPARRAELAQGIHELLRLDTAHDLSEDARVRAGVDEVPSEEGGLEGLPPLAEQAEPSFQDRSPSRAVEPAQSEPITGPEDVFLDLLNHLQQQRAEEEAQDQAPPTEEVGPGLPGAMTEPIVITTLAGSGKDRFNRHMSQAARMMEDGRYYDAAKQYEYATILTPSNPLAHAGQSLAYFGAGEPGTAAHRLMRALRLFPPLMETRIQVVSLVGEKAYEKRLGDLNGLLSTEFGRKQKTLVLLATYLHHNAGNRAEAEVWAERLMEMTLRDKLLNAYARFVLRGQRPSGQTATPSPEPAPR